MYFALGRAEHSKENYERASTTSVPWRMGGTCAYEYDGIVTHF